MSDPTGPTPLLQIELVGGPLGGLRVGLGAQARRVATVIGGIRFAYASTDGALWEVVEERPATDAELAEWAANMGPGTILAFKEEPPPSPRPPAAQH